MYWILTHLNYSDEDKRVLRGEDLSNMLVPIVCVCPMEREGEGRGNNIKIILFSCLNLSLPQRVSFSNLLRLC